MKPEKPKPFFQWAIYSPFGQVVSDPKNSRSSAIIEQELFAQDCGWKRWKWRQQYDDGYRCLRVELIPVKKRSKR